MTNVTIAIDDDLLRRARVRAAQAGTSVNAVVREELERFAGGAEHPADAFLAFAEAHRCKGGEWNRDDLYLERFETP